MTALQPPWLKANDVLDAAHVISRRARWKTLRDADLELLRVLADGHGMGAAASKVHQSDRTVRRRVRALCDRFGARAAIQLVVWAVRDGVI